MTVTEAKGFLAGALRVGINGLPTLNPSRADLAIVIAEAGPVPAAGVFTRNSAAAAPVVVSRARLAEGVASAVILNSGCANAGTGAAGIADVELITRRVGDLLDANPGTVLMCSTGPIGPRLPSERILDAVPHLVETATRDGGDDAAEAILTTDSRAKTTVVDGSAFVVGGMAKGSGMLRPDMATMLCVLTTDASADANTLQRVLAEAVPTTFNSLNVDGCESTNDTVLLLASGLAMPARFDELGEAVEAACRQLAYEMAADAEGATRVVKLRIKGAPDHDAARQYGRAVADSGLVRASFYGGDPNWGRILAALGSCGVDPRVVSISYEGHPVADGGTGVPFDDQELQKLLSSDFVIDIEVGKGRGQAEITTTDLTPDYVRFNGERS